MGAGYYDELTGKNSTKYEGINQPKQVPINPGNGETPYVINTVADETNIIDTGLLGITSISIKTSTSFIPSVTIELEDIQGKALFELGNNSPYSAFFNLPYCPFYLTLKYKDSNSPNNIQDSTKILFIAHIHQYQFPKHSQDFPKIFQKFFFTI